MKKSDIYEIAIKILGLYIVVILIGQVRDLLTYAVILIPSQNPPNDFSDFYRITVFIVMIFSFLLLSLFSCLLIFKTKKLTKLICKKDDFEESITLFTDKKTIYEIALTLVGLLTIILTLPEFALKFKNYIQLIQNEYNSKGNDTIFIITSGLKIFVGVMAIAYSKSISDYLATDKKEAEIHEND